MVIYTKVNPRKKIKKYFLQFVIVLLKHAVIWSDVKNSVLIIFMLLFYCSSIACDKRELSKCLTLFDACEYQQKKEKCHRESR